MKSYREQIQRKNWLKIYSTGFSLSIFIFLIQRIARNQDNYFMPCITLENGSYVAESLNSEKLVILNKSDSSNINDPVPSGHVLVPNIIHYIRWNNPEYSFNDYVCFRSAYLNHKPNMFYIHTNTNFTGKYWNKVTEELKWTEKIKIVWLEPPTHIFGQKMDRDWAIHHGSDFERIKILIKYGGIYLDNDMFIVKNLDYFRRYQMTIGWDDSKPLFNGIFIASKDAEFLKLWLNTYKRYYNDRWYYNSGELPTYRILYVNPSLVHRVKSTFGNYIASSLIYNANLKNWTDYFTIHILSRHRDYLDKKNFLKFGEYNEENILECNCTFTSMVMTVLPVNLMNSFSK